MKCTYCRGVGRISATIGGQDCFYCAGTGKSQSSIKDQVQTLRAEIGKAGSQLAYDARLQQWLLDLTEALADLAEQVEDMKRGLQSL